MLEIMYLNVYTFSFVNYLTTFVICLPTNFHFLLYFTKVRQFSVTADLSIHLKFRAQNVACASHSAHSCSGVSILWYHWVLELVSKGDCFVYVQFGPVEVLGKASDMAWQGKTPDTKPTDLNLIPRIHLVEVRAISSDYILWILNMCFDGIHIHAITLYVHIHTYTYTAHSYTCRTYTCIYTHM